MISLRNRLTPNLPGTPRTARWLLPFVVAACLGGVAGAQTPGAEPAPPHAAPAADADAADSPAEGARDLHDPAAPVGAVRGFIDAARDGDYEKAAQYLNLEGGRRAGQGPQLARKLKTVLDRKLWIDYSRLSSQPRGDLDDGLPPRLERVGTIDGAEILLERVKGSDGNAVWKFAASTVAHIPELDNRFGYGRLGEFLPAWMFEISLLEVQLWQWTGLLLLVIVVWAVSWVVARLLWVLLRPLVARTATQLDDELLRALLSPFRYAVALGLLAAGSLALALSLPALQLLSNVLKGLAVVAAAWFGLRVVDILADAVRRHLEETDRRAVVAVVPLGARVAKVVLGAIALVVVLQNLGFNVTGLIAGLGVGGLAVALAAQKSVANLFGGVSLIADQPVRVGDFCRVGGNMVGTVEEIGIRSTRLRTLDRTLVTIPNSEFSEMQLENFAARDRIRLHAVLGLRYETSPDQLRAVLAEVRKLLVSHPKITADPARVRFINFGAHSLDLEIFAYVGTSVWDEFLQVREDVFLRVMDIVRQCGSGFAFPSQTLYLGRDGGLDAERVEQTEARVREWRESGELPFPDYAPATLQQLDGSLEYPPRGSVGVKT